MKRGRKKGGRFTPGRLRHLGLVGYGYSPNEDNIGNLKSDSYLQAMLQVYEQCWKVLKDNGLMILVLKNFIRDKKIVRLDLDTISLCEQAEFSLQERHYRKLTAQSFWRTIALQRCDYRRGSKNNPKCSLGLTCPVEEARTADLFGRKVIAKQIEKLCSHYVNTSPEIEREDILIFRKDGKGGIVDEVVMSPPYVETLTTLGKKGMRIDALSSQINYAHSKRPRYPNYKDISTRTRDNLGRWISSNNHAENNIGNLPYGEIDKVIL